jgi:hypothetical protein
MTGSSAHPVFQSGEIEPMSCGVLDHLLSRMMTPG